MCSKNNFSDGTPFEACHSNREREREICLFNQSFPRLSTSSACFRSSMLISPLLASHPPHLLLPTPYFSLCFFSLSHVSLPPINPSYNLHCHSLSPFLFPIHPHYLLPRINLGLLLSGFYPLLFKCLPPLPSLSSTIYLHLCLHLWCAHSGWRRPTQSSQGAEGLSTPTQALRHGTQRNRDRGERTDGRRTHWLPVL